MHLDAELQRVCCGRYQLCGRMPATPATPWSRAVAQHTCAPRRCALPPLPVLLFLFLLCLSSLGSSAATPAADLTAAVAAALKPEAVATASNGAATAGSATTAPSSSRTELGGMAPLWGCETPSLEPGSMHVVVSTYNADPEQLLPWLWHLGLTNAAVYVYYRLDSPYIQRQYHGTVQLPCGMSLHVLPLLPNKGREAAVFLHHIVAHYDNLPLAMLLAHDHGPASRHSLCGPFYRRARGYYRGLKELQDGRGGGSGAAAEGEQRDLEAEDVEEEADGEGRTASKKGPTAGKKSHFARLASMVVTLSSGCIESWARGCCSSFICSSYKRACPFAASDNCTFAEPSRRGGYRHIFMHQYGMYDVRYENQVLGAEGNAKPVALLRYVGAAHRSVDMWNITHEYPPDETRHSKEQTLAFLKDLLERYGFSERRKSWFKSCCASLIVRREALLRWPVELYRELLAYSMDPAMDYEATKAVSGPGWSLWLDKDYTPQDTMSYLRVDFQLKHMQGCPAQYSPYMQSLVKAMREHAQGAPEASSFGAATGAVP